MPALSPLEAQERFLEVFGRLFPKGEWTQAMLEPVLSSIRYRDIEAGATILREGQSCASVPFVMAGSIRVFKAAESGREITLYRIERGQSCILSSGCGNASGAAAGIAAFPATAVAEKATRAAFMPHETVRRLLAEGASFRDYVLDQYSARMAGVIELVEEVAFRHLDERLRQWLAERSAASNDRRVAATHQEIADQLGSSREVVSRILKDWEQRGALELSRGAIGILSGFEKLPL
jgi:CRP/FNR family transcriptional regulator, anaerobic regulatory protein